MRLSNGTYGKLCEIENVPIVLVYIILHKVLYGLILVIHVLSTVTVMCSKFNHKTLSGPEEFHLEFVIR